MTNWQGITGVNRAYVLELYDRYLKDPNAVDRRNPCPFRDLDAARRGRTGTWDAAVPASGRIRTEEGRSCGEPGAVDPAIRAPRGQTRPARLAAASATLARSRNPRVTDDDLRALPPTLISSPLADGAANMLDVVNRFRALYCSTSGHDYSHVFVPEERQWLRRRWRAGRFRARPIRSTRSRCSIV